MQKFGSVNDISVRRVLIRKKDKSLVGFQLTGLQNDIDELSKVLLETDFTKDLTTIQDNAKVAGLIFITLEVVTEV